MAKSKFGPTRGEYLFRLLAGLFILGLIGVAIVMHGVPKDLVPSESILFGGVFALSLVVHSANKLRKGDYR